VTEEHDSDEALAVQYVLGELRPEDATVFERRLAELAPAAPLTSKAARIA